MLGTQWFSCSESCFGCIGLVENRVLKLEGKLYLSMLRSSDVLKPNSLKAIVYGVPGVSPYTLYNFFQLVLDK